MNDSEKLTNLWNVLHPDVVVIVHVPNNGWYASTESQKNYTKVTHLNSNLFPSAPFDRWIMHTRPVDKTDLLRQVEEQLVNLWQYIKPGYDWLAADSDGDGKFDWYCYNYRPSQQTSNEDREWSFEDDCRLLYGLHIIIPAGLEWHDLIFQRPK